MSGFVFSHNLETGNSVLRFEMQATSQSDTYVDFRYSSDVPLVSIWVGRPGSSSFGVTAVGLNAQGTPDEAITFGVPMDVPSSLTSFDLIMNGTNCTLKYTDGATIMNSTHEKYALTSFVSVFRNDNFTVQNFTVTPDPNPTSLPISSFVPSSSAPANSSSRSSLIIPPRKTSGTNILLIVGIVGGVAVILGLGAFLFFRNRRIRREEEEAMYYHTMRQRGYAAPAPPQSYPQDYIM